MWHGHCLNPAGPARLAEGCRPARHRLPNGSKNVVNDCLGWAAAGLTLVTFACAEPRRLRVMAITSNLAFMAYGASADLGPVLALHAALLPINLWRLRQGLRSHEGQSRNPRWKSGRDAVRGSRGRPPVCDLHVRTSPSPPSKLHGD
jgi:hypothetical protein